MSQNSILLLILGFLFSACTSYRVVLTPQTTISTYWHQGREYIGLTDDRVAVHCGCDRATPGQLVFYVEITNLMDERIDVFPSRFYYTYRTGAKDTTTRRVYAKNPESEIDRVEVAKDHEEDAHLISSSADVACCCLNFISGIVHTTKGEHEEAEKARERSDDAAERMEDEQEEHEQKISELEMEQDYWENTVLRRTTLMKDETIGGLVIFTNMRSAKYLVLNFPIEKSLLQFQYEIAWVEY